ncbi:MAG TPA: tetratricopeptide repeat protein [Vicinamibacterales bacterium]|nr:tetratricopeptide repeat protein [Vicinamibacterales bacterium]
MKRPLAFLGLVLLVVGVATVAAVIYQHIGGEQQYRRLLADGERAMRAGNGYAAIEAFSGALAFRPDSMVAHYRRAEAYRSQSREDEALRDLREAVRLAPDAPQPLIALGEISDLRGESAQAASWYAQAVEQLRDENPALLYQLALARYRAGSPAAARDPLRRLVARNDSLAEAHYLLGLVYRDMQDVDAAMNSLEQAVRIAPALTAAREELADLYRSRGRFGDEMDQLRALVDGDDPVGRRVTIALVEARRDQFASAIGMLGQAAVESPNDSRVQLALGRIYLQRAERAGDAASVQRALDVLERALGGTAPRSEGLALFGRALFLSGDLAGAERMLKEAVATSPLDPEAFSFLADAAERLGHDVIARDALVSLDALEGGTVKGDTRGPRSRRIGALSLRAGDPRLAVTYLTEAVNLGQAGLETLAQLARAKWLAGDIAGAKETLARALVIDPRNSELLKLARAMK